MSSVPQGRSANPTSSHTKVVAPGQEKSRTLRGMLATLLRFLRRGRPLPPIEGNLSSWICQLHGLVQNPETNQYRPPKPDSRIVPNLATWIEQIASPKLDMRKTQNAAARVNKTRRAIEELALLYGKNQREFNSQFSRLARDAMGAWGVPDGLPAISQMSSLEGALKMSRATYALAVCLGIYEEHPVSLITRASKGDRQAALDLVKVDNLFLHDRCTEKVIREAELRNDRLFMEQLTRAQTYQPNLRGRTVHHLYFYLVFMLEDLGTQLPTEQELWRILDPHGREYTSLSAFERDFQRRREAFTRMLSDADSQIKDAKL
jgi:hypothetical protein